MTRQLLAILLLLPLLAQGGEKRLTGGASYKSVCSKTSVAGITSRTQTTPATDSITDNVLLVVGADGFNQSRENRLISNTEIFVGASVTGVSTYTSNTSRAYASQADPCASVIDAKTPEVTLPTPEAEPSPAPNLSGR